MSPEYEKRPLPDLALHVFEQGSRYDALRDAAEAVLRWAEEDEEIDVDDHLELSALRDAL